MPDIAHALLQFIDIMNLLDPLLHYYYYYYRNRARGTHMNTHEKNEIKKHKSTYAYIQNEQNDQTIHLN